MNKIDICSYGAYTAVEEMDKYQNQKLQAVINVSEYRG